MPNKNYIAGRRKEYKVMNKFKQEGLIAFRSAGSHSPIDVIGINPIMKRIYLVQCKPKSLSAPATQRLKDDLFKLEGTYEVYTDVLQ